MPLRRNYSPTDSLISRGLFTIPTSRRRLSRKARSTPATMSKQQATLSNVEATFYFVEATFDFVATNGNNVERFYCKMSSFRQSRMLLRHCRKNRSTGSIRQCCWDIVAGVDGVSTKLPVASTMLLLHCC